MRSTTTGRWALAGATAIVATLLSACEPPPPRATFTVTANLEDNGPDAAPGDGLCATALGSCSLRAAIDEANATTGGVDVLLPASSARYGHPIDAEVTGDVAIIASGSGVQLTGDLSVATGGRLSLVGINTAILAPPPSSAGVDLDLEVHGFAGVQRSVVRSITVSPGGAAVLDRAVAIAPGGPALANHGEALVIDSALLVAATDGATTPVVVLDGSGDTHLERSVIATPSIASAAPRPGGRGTCAGTGTVTSHGAVHVEVPCTMAAAAGDGSGPAGWDLTLLAFGPVPLQVVSLTASSTLVDAIPVGVGCDPGATDALGRARGTDGDGDGTPGCDIGPLELPAA